MTGSGRRSEPSSRMTIFSIVMFLPIQILVRRRPILAAPPDGGGRGETQGTA